MNLHQKIFGIFILILDVGIPRHPERHHLGDAHAGKEILQIVRDDLTDRDVLRGALEPVHAGWNLGNLHASEQTIRISGPFKLHAHRDAHVGDEGEPVTGIDRQWRQNRKHVLVVPILGFLTLRIVEVLPGQDFDPSFAQGGKNASLIGVELLAEQGLDSDPDLFQKNGRAVRLALDRTGTGVDSTLHAADTLHEEFVEVVREDGKETNSLEKRRLGIICHLENTTVEFKPSEITIEITLRDRWRGMIGSR